MRREIEVLVDTIGAQMAEGRREDSAMLGVQARELVRQAAESLRGELQAAIAARVKDEVEAATRALRETALEAQLAGARAIEAIAAERERVAVLREELAERVRTLRDGNDGHDGPPGAAGAAGPQGEAGPAGRDAADVMSPVWSAGIYRAGTVVQHHFGQHFRALRDTASEPAQMVMDTAGADWERIGSGGWRLVGAFDEQRRYLDGDLVVRDFGAFVGFAGRLHLVAGRGKSGPQGERGVPGRDGAAGRHGRDGVGVLDVLVNDDGFVLSLTDGRLVPFALTGLVERMVEAAHEREHEAARMRRAARKKPNGHDGAVEP